MNATLGFRKAAPGGFVVSCLGFVASLIVACGAGTESPASVGGAPAAGLSTEDAKPLSAEAELAVHEYLALKAKGAPREDLAAFAAKHEPLLAGIPVDRLRAVASVTPLASASPAEDRRCEFTFCNAGIFGNLDCWFASCGNCTTALGNGGSDARCAMANP
jgi:hypothetical protein